MCFLSLRACLTIFGFLVTKANTLMGGRPLRLVQAGRGPNDDSHAFRKKDVLICSNEQVKSLG